MDTFEDSGHRTQGPPVRGDAGQESTGAHLTGTERSVLGGLGVALMGAGLRGARPLRRIVLVGAGAGLAALAASGRNPLATALKIRQNAAGETLVSDAVTVARPAEELYRLWRDLEGLPARLGHLRRVEVLDGTRSRWTVAAPVGEVSWEARITADEPGRRIAWMSLPGADIDNSGEILFRAAPGDRGTEVIVRLRYRPPGGSTGALIARIAGEEPAQQLRDDLMSFKREQELGLAPTTEGQSSGRAPRRPGSGT